MHFKTGVCASVCSYSVSHPERSVRDAVDEVPLMDEQSESSEENSGNLKSVVYAVNRADYKRNEGSFSMMQRCVCVCVVLHLTIITTCILQLIRQLLLTSIHLHNTLLAGKKYYKVM